MLAQPAQRFEAANLLVVQKQAAVFTIQGALRSIVPLHQALCNQEPKPVWLHE